MGTSESKTAGEKGSNYSWRTTSDQIGAEFASHAAGKHVLVTGGNCGLGEETARILAKHGAIITITSRSVAAGEEAARKIKEETPSADISVMQVDLASLKSVRELCHNYKSTGKPLHILINNAGIMACPKTSTADGLETQIGVNHFGHFLLTMELLDVLKASSTENCPSRVVNLSSLGQFLFAPVDVGVPLNDLNGDKNYHPWVQYGISKLCNVLMAAELNRRMAAENQPVIAVSLHPGTIIETNLKRHVSISATIAAASSLFASSRAFYYASIEPMKTVQQGTATTILCALDPAIVPGEYYSHCRVEDKLIHPLAKNETLQRELWETSLRITAAATSDTANPIADGEIGKSETRTA